MLPWEAEATKSLLDVAYNGHPTLSKAYGSSFPPNTQRDPIQFTAVYCAKIIDSSAASEGDPKLICDN